MILSSPLCDRIPEMHGLILLGGKSSRMGSDKSMIVYDRLPERERLFQDLSQFCDSVYFSCHAGQADQLTADRTIADRYHAIGPMGGLLSALEFNPSVAWLAVGCDMPNINENAIGALATARDPQCAATVALIKGSERPEPLFAIWEPSILPILMAARDVESYSLTTLLRKSRIKRVPFDNPELFTNINTPQDLAAFRMKREN